MEVIPWFTQPAQQRAHFLKVYDDAGRPVPYCRESAFAKWPHVVAEGIASLASSPLCSKCTARMPLDIRRSIEAALQDQKL